MTENKCYVCKCNPGPFYVWTTSRHFPREKLIATLDLSDKYTMNDLSAEGKKVCFKCYEELKD